MSKKEFGIAGKIAKFFVHNEKIGFLSILVLFFTGVIAFLVTPKQYNPEITAPAFNVITQFPSASSEEVENLVTTPIEDLVTDIKGVDEVMSQSLDGGVSIVTVQFDVGEDTEDSKVKLLTRLSGNFDLSPIGVSEPLIKELNPDDIPIMTLALSSKVFSEEALRKMAFDLKDEIKKVNGTSNIQVVGGRKTQYKVLLNPGELMAKNISIAEISQAINGANVKVNGGYIKAEVQESLIEVDGLIEDIEDLQKVVVRNDNGEIVYLEDVASVLEGPEDINDFVRMKGKENEDLNTVFLSIAKVKGENITKVSDAVIEEMERLREVFLPAEVNLEVVNNEGDVAKKEISGLSTNLLSSILIVALVLYFALGLQSSLVVSITIPLTLASVFAVGFLAGQSINRITLFALILSLGLLVDNATVVIENINRHLKLAENDKSEKHSIVRAVDEVGQGLIMSSVTTLLAFFPMAFVTGMMGPYMGPIPFFVPAAILISLVIAFTINPYLSAVFLTKKRKEKKEHPKIVRVKEKLSRYMEKYKSLLRKLFSNSKLRKKVLAWLGLALVLSLLLPAVAIVKFRMLPKADKDQFFVYLDMPELTSAQETDRVARMIEEALLEVDEVDNIQSFVGTAPILDFNGLFKGAQGRTGSHQATLRVNLLSSDDRRIKSENLVFELRPLIAEALKGEPDAYFKLIEDPPGPPVMATLLLKVKGENLDMLQKIAKDFEMAFVNTAEVVDVDSTVEANSKRTSLKLNYVRMAESGITVDKVVEAIAVGFGGKSVSTVHVDGAKEQEEIFMQFDRDERNEADDLSKIFVKNHQGVAVPLLSIAEMVTEGNEAAIFHDGGERTVYVFAEMGERSVTYAALELFMDIWAYSPEGASFERTGVSPLGVEFVDQISGEEFSIKFGGEWELTLEVFRDLGLAMMVAIFLIYFVLVGQFNSFKSPLLIMVTIPLALIGVLPGFAVLGLLLGIYFNATSMIGVIALAGIVVNNAIIFMEYLEQLLAEGMGLEDALVEAGSTRLRPIVLTSLTTILGSLTIVGDPVWAGLAWSIIFGLSISAILTLVVFPLLYFMTMKDGRQK